MKKILIGGAWPYANGPLHIGHIAALLPGDIIARYYRLNGNKVYYVSGSDCHGTPITIRAKLEGKTPKAISDKYHKEFEDVFNAYGFSYDFYGKTSSNYHIDFVTEFHKSLYDSDYIYEKESNEAFCKDCNKVLTDRLVVGTCPNCGANTRGDQCDNCNIDLQSNSLLNPKCATHNTDIEFIRTNQLYLSLTKMKYILEDYLDSHGDWRINAKSFTKRYINEGLRDRAITRNLDWGIDVPKKGYDDKKIYIWAENVLGYLSSSNELLKKEGLKISDLWNDEESMHYYVHGKDNIPFHTIILPALLIANGNEYHLPDKIISSEHLTLEGKKISTSNNWAVWAKDLIGRYNIDLLRYFFVINGPEKRDTDFSFRELIERNNGELLGAYGNFVNRTIVFVEKYFNGHVPNGILDTDLEENIKQLYTTVGNMIREGNIKEALEVTFNEIRNANKYYDSEEPWNTRKNDIEKCANTMFNCLNLIANFSNLLSPFLPQSSRIISSWLNFENEWKYVYIKVNDKIGKSFILFPRLEKSYCIEDLSKLK